MVVVSNVLYCRFAQDKRPIDTECCEKVNRTVFSVLTEGVLHSVAIWPRAKGPRFGSERMQPRLRIGPARHGPCPFLRAVPRIATRLVVASPRPTSIGPPSHSGLSCHHRDQRLSPPRCTRVTPTAAAPSLRPQSPPSSTLCSPAHPGYCWCGSSLHYPPARGGLSSLQWPGHPSFPRRPLRPPLRQTQPPPMPNGGSPPVTPGSHLPWQALILAGRSRTF